MKQLCKPVIMLLILVATALCGCGKYGGVIDTDLDDRCYGKPVDAEGRCEIIPDPFDECYGKEINAEGGCDGNAENS